MPSADSSKPIMELPGGASLQVLYSYPLSNAPTLKIVALKITYAPGGFTPPHRHGNAFVVATVLKGRVQSQVNDQPVHEYGPTDAWNEDPGDSHFVSRNASQTEEAIFIATFVCPIAQDEYVVFDCPACEVARDA